MKRKALLFSPLALVPAGTHGAIAGPAAQPIAATMSPPAWTGLYLGLNLGGISAQSNLTPFNPIPGNFRSYCFGNNTCSSFSQNAVGVLGGAQIGYNFTSGPWVYGAETDFDFSSATKQTTGRNPYAFSGSFTARTGVKYLGTARLRLGYAFDKALVYATGGLAYAHMDDAFQNGNGVGNSYAFTKRTWQAGYTVGGGVEYLLSNRISIKGEALYYDLGKQNVIDGGGPGGTFAGISDRMTGVLGRIGINYFFH